MTQLGSSARTLDAAALGDGHDAGRPVETVVLRDNGRDGGPHVLFEEDFAFACVTDLQSSTEPLANVEDVAI